MPPPAGSVYSNGHSRESRPSAKLKRGQPLSWICTIQNAEYEERAKRAAENGQPQEDRERLAMTEVWTKLTSHDEDNRRQGPSQS